MKKIILKVYNYFKNLFKVKKQKKLGSLIIQNGHKLYEFNKVNFQLDFATYEIAEFNKVVVRDHCYYFSALNEKNAIKKVTKKFNPDFVAVMLPE